MKVVLLAFSVLVVLSTSARSRAFTAFKNASPVENGTRPVVKLASQGGPKGVDFDDFELSKGIVGIHSISLSYKELIISNKKRIDSFTVTYLMAGGQLQVGAVHGKPTSPTINITLGPSEHIWRIEGETDGNYVTALGFRTIGPNNDYRFYGPYGYPGSEEFAFENNIIAFHGASLIALNKIGVYGLPALNISKTHGGRGGSDFDDGTNVHVPAVVGIRRILVWNANIVDALQVEYVTLGGGSFLAGKHGEGTSKNMTIIRLEEGEFLCSLTVATHEAKDITVVSQLTFGVKTKSGKVVSHGPFGTLGINPITYTGNILGFHGSSGWQIHKIGVYLLNNTLPS